MKNSNMKYYILIIFILCSSLISVGCTPKDNNNVSLESIETKPVHDELDSIEDIENFEIDDVAVRELKEFPTEEIIANLETEITRIIERSTEVQLKELKIYEDDLLLKENQDKRRLDNIFIEFDIDINDDKDKKDMERIINETTDNLMMLFVKNTYIDKKSFLNTSRICRLIDSYNSKTRDEPVTASVHLSQLDKLEEYGLERIYIELDEDESQVQSYIYGVLDGDTSILPKLENPDGLYEYDVFINRMGIDKESNEYIVEIEALVGNGLYIENIENTIPKLKDTILNDDNVIQFFNKKGIKNIKFIFNTPWNDTKYFIFEYKVS